MLNYILLLSKTEKLWDAIKVVTIAPLNSIRTNLVIVTRKFRLSSSIDSITARELGNVSSIAGKDQVFIISKF